MAKVNVTEMIDAAQKLKTWRNAAKLKQAEAARLVPTSPATWCDLEAGKKLPGLEIAADIERVTEGAVTVADWTETARERRRQRDTDPSDPPTEVDNDLPVRGVADSESQVPPRKVRGERSNTPAGAR